MNHQKNLSLYSQKSLIKPSIDKNITVGETSDNMSLNIELQAKMIEDLILKNADISEANVQAE